MDALREGRVPINVREVPKRAINSDIDDYRPGDFILHFMGQPARVFDAEVFAASWDR